MDHTPTKQTQARGSTTSAVTSSSSADIRGSPSKDAYGGPSPFCTSPLVPPAVWPPLVPPTVWPPLVPPAVWPSAEYPPPVSPPLVWVEAGVTSASAAMAALAAVSSAAARALVTAWRNEVGPQVAEKAEVVTASALRVAVTPAASEEQAGSPPLSRLAGAERAWPRLACLRLLGLSVSGGKRSRRLGDGALAEASVFAQFGAALRPFPFRETRGSALLAGSWSEESIRCIMISARVSDRISRASRESK